MLRMKSVVSPVTFTTSLPISDTNRIANAVKRSCSKPAAHPLKKFLSFTGHEAHCHVHKSLQLDSILS